MNKPLTPDTELVNRIFMQRIIIFGLIIFVGLSGLLLRYGYLDNAEYQTNQRTNMPNKVDLMLTNF